MADKTYKCGDNELLNFQTKKIGNFWYIIIRFNGKVEFVLKEFIECNEWNDHAMCLAYYNTSYNLENYISNSYFEDLFNSDLALKIAVKHDLKDFKTFVTDEDIDEGIAKLTIDFIRKDAKGRREIMESNEGFLKGVGSPVNNEKAKEINAEFVTVDTSVGKLSIEHNPPHLPQGVYIKLNNSPILLVEENDELDNEKLVVKTYPNKFVVQDDNYMNLKSYGIDLNDLKEGLVNKIAESLNEEK